LIWRTPLGLEIRSYGKSQRAARYAGIGAVRITMIAMLISGALAGMMAINNVMGEAERLVLNAVEGAGFIGIAVALMGRSHPVGVFLAAILFGFLYQGGAELALWTSIPRELIVVIQALVILFTGALDNMVRMPLERMFLAMRRASKPKSTPAE
ncbi:MAG: ABC transporter permease, partial [Pseudomonadota bacterium]